MKVKYQQTSDTERAISYVKACPEALSGQHGHNQTFKVVCSLIEKFPMDAAREAAEYYNANCCSPSWSQKEFEHKWDDALKVANHYTAPVKKSSNPVVDSVQVKVTTTEDLPQPLGNPTITHLQTCFNADEFVNVAVTTADKKPVNGGATYTSADWVETLQATSSVYDILASEPIAKEGNGCYICVNPLFNDSKRSKDNVSSYRHLLVEFDHGSLTEQWNTICSSKLPCAVVVNSGGKSLHAWVKVNAKNADQYSTRQKLVYDSLAAFGIDKQNSDPCRYSRLAGQKRKDKTQDLLAVNIGCATFEQWQTDMKYRTLREKYPQAKPITDFTRPLSDDPNELLLHRFLAREGIAMLIANAGIGKSVVESQMAVTWALGKECLGIKPARPLKSLIIQAEDDDGDVGEMKDSVFAGMNIIPGSQAEDIVRQNVAVVSLDTVSGERFFECLELYLNDLRPDIVWINPVLSYLGGDANKQEVVGKWLRNGLKPLLHQYGAAAILIHHSAKPLKDGNLAWSTSDYTQFGLGSVEWGNAARAVIVILAVDDTSGTYIMKAAKRGNRLQWKDPLDPAKTTRDRYIRHSKTPGILQWYEASRDEIKAALYAQQQAKVAGLVQANAARTDAKRQQILAVIPEAPSGITRIAIHNETNLAKNTITRHINDLLESGEIVESEDVGRNKILSRPPSLDSEESE